MKQTASNENLEHHLITELYFKGPRTPVYGKKMNFSELHFFPELKWAVIYIASPSGCMQNLVSTMENKILIPKRWGFFILNLTECYQLMKYKWWNSKGTIDADKLLSELCHCGCLLCKTLHRRNFIVPKLVDSCSSSASFPFPLAR